ncbi:hypothetical protein LX32DRAFT_574425 [Colletotrichum zoysiae]|uniref:BTB domain-containing protein n=1 Tax=Colletotrichum zoysiae TaxID=1216348 RepID=A0AAD9H604_9PEZI|nr:hypothetical protein LX32DRAFT_574425 [Colletotrichum zoysiae]
MTVPHLPEAEENRNPKIGPKVSPYTSPNCDVYFRSGQLFRVPRDLLCEGLENIRKALGQIHLRDVPDEAGHTVLHYLHTSMWQTLDDADLPDEARPLNQLEVSLHVYATAQTYSLPGLAELAKQEIHQHAEALPALQVLVSASDACRLLGEDDLWLSAFIKLRVEELVRGNSASEKMRFLTCFDAATPYTKMLAGIMVDILCCKSSSPLYPEPRTPQSEPDTIEQEPASPDDPEGLASSKKTKKKEKTKEKTKGKKKEKKKRISEYPPEETVPPMAIAEPEAEPAPEPEPVQELEQLTEPEPESTPEPAPEPAQWT